MRIHHEIEISSRNLGILLLQILGMMIKYF